MSGHLLVRFLLYGFPAFFLLAFSRFDLVWFVYVVITAGFVADQLI